MADSDDEVVDHASLLNSFGNDNTNIITPVPRMHSIKPEWDEDVRYEECRHLRQGMFAFRVYDLY